jgi:NTE family protein
MPDAPRKRIALVLAGAVAKGAFEAGVLQILARSNVEVIRIVAASAGALNAVVYAAGIANERQAEAAASLAELWTSEASWRHVFHLNLADLFIHRDGISDQDKLLKVLRERVQRIEAPKRIELRILVSPLGGREGNIGPDPATTYEYVVDFDQTDFANDDSLEAVFEAAVASAAFPVAFAPAMVDGVGLCIDGGTCNNAPISRAIRGRGARDVDAIVVVTPSPKHYVAPKTDKPHFNELIGDLLEMVTNERLYRDLRNAAEVNEGIRKLEALQLPPKQLDVVRAAIGWENRTFIEIVEIRPEEPLSGSPFHGFFDRHAREDYIARGIESAKAVLGGKGWL